MASISQQLSSSTLRSLVNPRALQSLAAGTLLGSCIWGSFISGVIAVKTLPRHQFGNLQSKVFPVYSALTSYGSAAMLANWLYYHPGTFSSMLDSSKFWNANVFNAWLLAGGCLATSVINLFVVTPLTSKIMFKRHRLEKEEGKSYTDPAASPELKNLSTQFAVAHSVSSLANLAFLGAIVFHAAWLATYGF